MKLLYGKEPEKAELMEVKPVIHANVITTMKAIIGEAVRLGTEEQVVDKESMKKMSEMGDDDVLGPAEGKLVAALWADP